MTANTGVTKSATPYTGQHKADSRYYHGQSLALVNRMLAYLCRTINKGKNPDAPRNAPIRGTNATFIIMAGFLSPSHYSGTIQTVKERGYPVIRPALWRGACGRLVVQFEF